MVPELEMLQQVSACWNVFGVVSVVPSVQSQNPESPESQDMVICQKETSFHAYTEQKQSKVLNSQ